MQGQSLWIALCRLSRVTPWPILKRIYTPPSTKFWLRLSAAVGWHRITHLSEQYSLMTETGYQSPFSWRYGSDEMRALWSEIEKRKTWRRIWVALAEAEAEAGLVTREQ